MNKLAIATLAALTSFVITQSLPAEARWRRGHTSECATHQFGHQYTTDDDLKSGIKPTGALFACPIQDDERFPKSAIHFLNVHGYATATGVPAAAACIKYFGAAGGACGQWGRASGAGDTMLTPELSQWAPHFGADFGYILILAVGAGTIDGWAAFE